MYSEFVYILRAGPFFKIGRTNDITKRIAQITLQMPFRVELFKVINTDDSVSLESCFHRMFEHYRANGEWFTLPMEEIAKMWMFPPTWSDNPNEPDCLEFHREVKQQVGNEILESFREFFIEYANDKQQTELERDS